MISLNVIVINNKGDEVIWGGNSYGHYSIASRHFYLWDRMEKPIWAKAWIPGLTPKNQYSYGFFSKTKILTLDNLAKRGQVILNRCSLCKHALEIVNHLFIHCPYSSKVWNLLTRDFGSVGAPRETF